MDTDWYTTVGATGNLPVEQRNDGWYVSSSSTDENIKCLLGDGIELDESVENQQIPVTVDAYAIGVGSDDNLLVLSSVSHSVVSDGDAEKSLTEIAAETIGDEEFTVTQQDTESLVEGAKKQARQQQRDPAIDPRLHDTDDDTGPT